MVHIVIHKGGGLSRIQNTEHKKRHRLFQADELPFGELGRRSLACNVLHDLTFRLICYHQQVISSHYHHALFGAMQGRSHKIVVGEGIVKP